MTTFMTHKAGDAIELPASGGLPTAWHVFEADHILAVEAALATSRPLLVRGEPGTGKSQIARAAAADLNWAFVHTVVDARTETRDLLWSVDHIARLAEAHVMAACPCKDETALLSRMDVLNFVKPGVLWWAFAWEQAERQATRSHDTLHPRPPGWNPAMGCVVLIDEIDKADSSVPNGLLDALGHGRFAATAGVTVEMNPQAPPLVVVTTNEERALPDAFLRRCLVLHLDLPRDHDKLVSLLVRRGRQHFRNCHPGVLKKAAELLAKDRADNATGLYRPGQAEFIDLVRAVTTLRDTKKAQIDLVKKLEKFAFQKNPPTQTGEAAAR